MFTFSVSSSSSDFASSIQSFAIDPDIIKGNLISSFLNRLSEASFSGLLFFNASFVDSGWILNKRFGFEAKLFKVSQKIMI